MLIMHISQICSLISVFKNKIYETLIDKTLYECIRLITNLFSNILIFLQHLVISYITCLNTGTLVIKKYAHSDKCAHVCINTNTHTHTHTHTVLSLHNYIPLSFPYKDSFFFLLHLTLIMPVTRDRTRTLSITSTDSTLTSASTYCSVIDMSTFLKDFYIHPIHGTKAQTRRTGKTVLSLNLNIRWRRVLSSFSRHFTLGKNPDSYQSGGCTGPRDCLNMYGGDKSSSNWVSNSGLYWPQPSRSTHYNILVPHSFVFFHKSPLACTISLPITFDITSLTSLPQFTVRIMHSLKNHPGVIRVLNTLPLDVRRSMHHNIIHIGNPTRCHSVSKFYFIFI